MNKRFLDTDLLHVQFAPPVFHNDRMVLNGGTALSLFVREMPRLPVAVDLVFVDRSHRAARRPDASDVGG